MSVSDPFAPIREGFNDLRGAFDTRNHRKLLEKKIDADAKVREHENIAENAKRQALAEYGDAIEREYGPTAGAAARAGKSLSPLIKKGKGGGGGRKGSGDSDPMSALSSIRGDLSVDGEKDAEGNTDVSGQKYDLNTAKKLLQQTETQLMEVAAKIGQPGQDFKALNKLQIAFMRKRRNLLNQIKTMDSFPTQLKEAKSFLGEKEFTYAMQDFQGIYDDEIAPVLQKQGFSEDQIHEHKKKFIGGGFEALPVDGDVYLSATRMKDKIADDIEANEPSLKDERFFDVVKRAPAETLKAMVDDPNATKTEKHYATQALINRKFFDLVEGVTGKFIPTVGQSEDFKQKLNESRTKRMNEVTTTPSNALRRKIISPPIQEDEGKPTVSEF